MCLSLKKKVPFSVFKGLNLKICAVLLCAGFIWCSCRCISVKPGSLKPKLVPCRYLGQPSPYTHPHLIKHGRHSSRLIANCVNVNYQCRSSEDSEPVVLYSSGEVTPGIAQTEYELRRQKLASLIEAQADKLGPSTSSSNHVVIILSHPTHYMTNDIPYPFHQNQVHLRCLHPQKIYLPC